jgi:hypothetical protein
MNMEAVLILEMDVTVATILSSMLQNKCKLLRSFCHGPGLHFRTTLRGHAISTEQ